MAGKEVKMLKFHIQFKNNGALVYVGEMSEQQYVQFTEKLDEKGKLMVLPGDGRKIIFERDEVLYYLFDEVKE